MEILPTKESMSLNDVELNEVQRVTLTRNLTVAFGSSFGSCWGGVHRLALPGDETFLFCGGWWVFVWWLGFVFLFVLLFWVRFCFQIVSFPPLHTKAVEIFRS